MVNTLRPVSIVCQLRDFFFFFEQVVWSLHCKGVKLEGKKKSISVNFERHPKPWIGYSFIVICKYVLITSGIRKQREELLNINIFFLLFVCCSRNFCDLEGCLSCSLGLQPISEPFQTDVQYLGQVVQAAFEGGYLHHCAYCMVNPKKLLLL